MRVKPNLLKTETVPVRGSQGPGTYEADKQQAVQESAPKYRIGTSKRNTDTRNLSPGPGTYDCTGKTEGPLWVFGSDTRTKEISKKDGPGPGTYQVPSRKDQRSYSMRPRYKAPIHTQSPGPGAYSPKTSGETPLFSIGRSQRNTFRDSAAVPGPGTYQNRTWTEDISSSIRFGTSDRRSLSAMTQAPGPGSYQTRGKAGEGPAFTMRQKASNAKRPEVPVICKQGPGTYEQDIKDVSFEASTKSKFGTSKRGSGEHSGNPVGPGMYDVRGDFIGPKWGFGTSGRSELRPKTANPGPGAYSIKPTVPDLPPYVRS
jgi:hypothetical protein